MNITRAALGVALAGVLLATGCSGGGSTAGKPAATKSTAPTSGAQVTPPIPAPVPGAVTAIPAETDAEKAAVALAAKSNGRKWAAGNPSGPEAAGDPFLVGYYITLYQGDAQYVVCVIDGKAVPYFGLAGPKFVKSEKDAFNTPSAPSTDRQKAAVDTAKAFVASVAPKAEPGGISMYLVYFPQIGQGASAGYPSVSVFTKAVSGQPFAAGGLQFR